MSKLFRRYFYSFLIVLTLLATSCRVARQIEAGQKVSINPCSLVETAKIEKALVGNSTPPQLALYKTWDGKDGQNGCRYEKQGREGNGEYFEILLSPETMAELDRAGQKVTGIGRDSAIREDKRHGLNLYVLSNEGARATFGISVQEEDEKGLIQKVKPLARQSISRIDKKLPSHDEMKGSPPPHKVCSLASEEEVAQLAQSEFDTGNSFEEELIGGSSGGRWGCWHTPYDATLIVYFPKDPANYESRMATAASVKGVGAKAYWKPPVREPSAIYGQLYVVTKNGKAFGIDVDFYDADDEAHKVLATELAKIILTRI